MSAGERGEGRAGLLERVALHRPELRAWAMYDWANSAFWLTVITAVFPVFYEEALARDVEPATANLAYSTATTVALAIAAVLAPLLGTLADLRGLKKRLLGAFVAAGSLATLGLFLLLPGDWVPALLLFGLANVCVAVSVVFYDALLPHVARPQEMDRLSTSGFALGYLGSGLLLVGNLAVILSPDTFGLPSGEGLSEAEATLPTRLAFLSVAIWWGVFSLPLLLRVSEPPPDPEEGALAGRSALAISVGRLRRTFGELRRYRQALRLLVAFLIYNDGIATLIRMAALYAATRGIEKEVTISSILALQFVAVPFALLFGQLGSRFGAKRMVLVGLTVYACIAVCAYLMSATWHFVGLALLVGTVQGGTQGLSRSLFASMIPARKSGEFFALFAVGEKFAGLVGPGIFSLAIWLTGDMQPAVLSLIGFFVLGGLLLARVDVAAGAREAAAVDDPAAA